MAAERDFKLTVNRAAGLTVDALCAARAAQHGRLPEYHRARLRAAVRSLQRAQDELFDAQNTPWSANPPRPHCARQLALEGITV